MHESVPPVRAAGMRGPSLGFLALAVLASVLCAWLGLWQWHKGQARTREWAGFARGAAVVMDLGHAATGSVALYQQVRVAGLLDAGHQFLIDNRSWRGRPGYEVLTPLLRPGAATLLVDRGWLPLTGSRRELPDVSLPPLSTVTLSGRLGSLPSGGLAMGHAAPQADAPWPKVTSFPVMAELSIALGSPLEPRILLLDPAQALGYVRDWQPPGMAPLRHFSYAIQWWSFAALSLFLWGLITFRRRRAAVNT